jgi:ABC-2 type transport system ATP-binding protein
MSVEVSNLVKKYGSQSAVNDVSFIAKKGEIVGFLGPNGAGKSTTMKIITCYIPATTGNVKVCGYDVNQQSIEVRKTIGYLPEHNPLYLDMYVHEYLSFIGNIHQIKGNELSQRKKLMIELCGLGLEQNKKIGTLSKGYRQRVGLAQALIHDPQVLILDEPTTGLDPNQLVEIRNLIKEVSKEKTVLFSTHIMQEVQALCQRVLIINKGQIVADDSVDRLTQTQTGKTTITIEFLEEIDRSFFESIASINTIKPMSNKKYELGISDQMDIRPILFALAKEKNVTILELHSQTATLENIFHQLTNNQNV